MAFTGFTKIDLHPDTLLVAQYTTIKIELKEGLTTEETQHQWYHGFDNMDQVLDWISEKRSEGWGGDFKVFVSNHKKINPPPKTHFSES